MNWIRRIVTRRQLDRDLADEIQAHLVERVDELLAEGMPLDAARLRAQREFGNVTAIEERGREVWRWTVIENLWADLRYGARQLRGSPAFAAALILTLALGIGVNAAVFSIVDTVMLRPLPFPDPDRLVAVAPRDLRGGPHPVNLCYPTFFDFRRDNRVFENIASFREDRITLSGRGAPLSLPAQIVSNEFFRVLNVPMARGRGFLSSEERAGTRVAVLSYEIWTTVFGQDPSLVGRTVTLDGAPFQIVGITRAGFTFPLGGPQSHVWTTLARDAGSGTVVPVTEQRGARMLSAIARLAPGVSIAGAQAGMDVVAAAVARQYPASNANLATTYVRPALEAIVGEAREPVALLWGAVALVLLTACANVANMLLARTADREREYGLRLAIGGSRARVVQQLLAENLLLTVAGSGVGVLMALATLRVLVPFAAGHVPRIESVGLDLRLLGFAVMLALLTAVVCSVPAARRVCRVDFGSALRGQSRTSTDLKDGGRGMLVTAQIAVGLVLLTGASVLTSGVLRMLNRDLGLEPRQLLTFQIGLPGAQYPDERRLAFIDSLLDSLATEPGVTAAAGAMPLPLEGESMRIAFDIEERPSGPSRRPGSNMALVTPGFFATLGTTLVEGRDFSRHDEERSPAVAIVNQAFARRFFPGERAIGKRFEPGATGRRGRVMCEIVGVVANARQSPMGPEPEPIFYLPYRQLLWGPPSILVRTTVPPLSLESSIRRLVDRLDKDVPINDLKTMETVLESGTAAPRLAVGLMSMFATIGMALIATGVYGLLTYAVLRRTRELGVRIALGATRRSVVGLVLKRAGKLTMYGLLLGLVGAFAIARLFGHVFLDAADPPPWLLPAAALIVTATSLVGAFMPAARAAAIDPTDALRRE
jgi:putative ABC transport system permease protein